MKNFKKIIGVVLISLTVCSRLQAANPGLGITWTCISNCTDVVEDGIYVQQSLDSTNWNTIASLATNSAPYLSNAYIITNLPDRTTFCYRIAAFASCCGTGDWSNVICKTTKGRPIKIYLLN